MKKITLTALMLFTALGYAQVGINTNNPDASSALEIESTTGGILIPRLTQTQRDAIDAPATGLMIYQTNQTAGFYFYDGAAWTKINGAADTTLQSNIDAVQDDVDQNELDADASFAAVNILAMDAFMLADMAQMEAEYAQSMAMDAQMEANMAQNMADMAQMEANMAQSMAMQNTEAIMAQRLDSDAADAALQSDIDALQSAINGISPSLITVNTFYAELGGYVIEVNSDGTHGLVVAMQDQGNSNWYEANDLLSNTSNHDTDGGKFMDWRLPTKRELNLIRIVYSSGNGANLGATDYWSSTETSANSAMYQYMATGDQYPTAKDTTYYYVRAVRAF